MCGPFRAIPGLPTLYWPGDATRRGQVRGWGCPIQGMFNGNTHNPRALARAAKNDRIFLTIIDKLGAFGGGFGGPEKARVA